nr:cilia- and flagella-associated protein 300 isoform X1 [Misgurnus anguillicaudatus]
MLGRITTQAFNFDQSFQPYRSNDFAWDFFQDPHVKNNLKVLDSSGSWTLLGRDITHVNAEVVPCTKVSVDMFDPVYSNGILRPSGHIVKCYHEIYPDFDELRMILLEEDSDNYHIFSASDRQEFLFRLFKHVVLGGELCQYEDVVDPYIDTAKIIYKDMVSVQKDPETKTIGVVSTVLKVSAYDASGLCYPSGIENEQTFAYLSIDPFKRHVYILYHSFGIGDFSEN